MQEIFTFLKSRHSYLKIESNYLPGVPRFTVLNFGPRISKELSLKIRSALSSEGFSWSLRKQALFSIDQMQSNVKELHELELSIIIKYLTDTQQIKFDTKKKIVAVGEVTIHGKVKPFPLHQFTPEKEEIWIGNFNNNDVNESLIDIKNIGDLRNVEIPTGSNSKKMEYRLSFLDLVSIYGSHSKMILNNKTVDLKREVCEALSFVNHHKPQENKKSLAFIDTSQNFSDMKKTLLDQSEKIIGIKNFHLLDERIKQSLYNFKNNNLILADTSLCPCGKAEIKKRRKCGFSLYRCRSTVEQLSLSGLSEFDIFQYKDKDFKLLNHEEIMKMWEVGHEIKKMRSNVFSQASSLEMLKGEISQKIKFFAHLPLSLGERRLKTILMLARTIADLKGHEKIEQEDLDLSLEYGFYPLKELVSLF